MTVTIQEVRIARFRGFRELVVVRLDGRGLVLLGDNGSGKSSLVEAIQYGLTGDVPSLSQRGQRVSLKRHGRHVKAAGEPQVVVVLEAGGRTVEVNPGTDVGALDEPFRSFVVAARTRQFLLRRSHVLQLVEAQDRDRYGALAPFLGVAAFSPVEEACADASRRAQRALRTEEAEVRRRREAVEKATGVRTESEVLAWMRDRAAALDRSLPESLGQALDALDGIETDPSFRRRDLLRSRLDSLRAFLDAGLGAPRIVELLENARTFDETEELRYEAVLQKGIRWLLDVEAARCPLCEQEIDAAAVVRRARARLARAEEALGARRSLMAVLEDGRSRLKSVLDGIDRMQPELLAELPGAERPLADLRAWVDGVRALLQKPRTELDASQLATLDDAAAAHAVSLQQLVEQLNSDPMGAAASQLVQVRDLVRRWQEAREPEGRARDLARRAQRLHELAKQARREAAQEVLEATADDVTAIYQAFHDGEDGLAVRVEIREKVSGSAKLLVDFLDQVDEDPRGLLSEGHLDTLGLALFFALARRGDGPKLLVLDDVLGTIDTTHRERVVRWLMDQVARDHQLIVTTHSRQWWEWLRHLQRVEGVDNRFRHLEVLASDGGVAGLVDVQTRIEELDQALSHAANPERIGRLAGAVLEAELREIRVAWRLAVPARPDERYTIGDIWPVLNKKLTKGRLRESFTTQIEAHRDRIDGLAPIRNWSAHPNDWSDLTRGSADAFAVAAKGLVQAFACAECGRRLVLETSGAVMCPKHCPSGVFI